MPKLAHAQMLWPGTTAGMPVEDVQRVFPDAHAPDDPTGLPKGRGVELLRIDLSPIADRAFTVHFFFKNRQLVHVSLTSTGEITLREFERYRDLLRKKYELERTTVNSEYLLVTWKIAQTTIELIWTPKGHDVAMLAIHYDAPIPKETDRL